MALDLNDKLAAFRLISQRRMTDILDLIGGIKNLVIDNELVKPLERFIGFKTLRSHGVEKIFKLDKKEASGGSANMVFLCRADLITAKRVCDHINATSGQQQFHLIAMPKIFHAIHVLVEEEGLHGKVTMHSFQWELLQIDHRLLSFESPDIFKSAFIASDVTFRVPCARTLWSLQHVLGKPRLKLFIGAHAKSLQSLMSELDESLGEPDSINSDIGMLLVIDRNVDYVSTLLTPGTYTSLLADVIGISSGLVQVPKPDGKVGPTTGMQLSSDDETYHQIRHQHYSQVVQYLKQKINQFYSEQAKRNHMTVQEMRNFVQNDLGKMANTGKILSNHLHLCEKIGNRLGKIFESLQSNQQNILTGDSRREVIAFIEDLIATGEEKDLVLRLICLLSICQGGLSQSEGNSLKLQFFHGYGHENLLTFYNLEKMNLITVNSNTADAPVKLASKVVQAVTMPRRNAFLTTVNKLKLFPEATDSYSLKNPQDLGYVFGGIYIPIIAQIVSSILKKERSLRELLKCLPADFADGLVEGTSLDLTPDVSPHCVWVYVVGGITYAEVAALALLELKTGCRIICSGTSIITGTAVVNTS